MQESLKRLVAELHVAYFKPNGFRKERQHFHRELGKVMQAVEFQSSSWNSSIEPVTFYVNIRVGFADIPMKDGKPALTGMSRITGLVPDAPGQYDLTSTNFELVRSELLMFLPQALSELPKHYEDVRTRAQAGWHTMIPFQTNWRA